MFELVDHTPQSAVIKVIGVGGGGGNAVNHMVRNNVEGVEFICANTDAQALKKVEARTVLQLGSAITKGLGAGTNPTSAVRLRWKTASASPKCWKALTWCSSPLAWVAVPVPVLHRSSLRSPEMGILTVAVVTRPFPFEGRRRMQVADEGIRALSECVDSLITIPNEKLLTILGKDASLLAAFAKADDVLTGAVRGISDIMQRPA